MSDATVERAPEVSRTYWPNHKIGFSARIVSLVAWPVWQILRGLLAAVSGVYLLSALVLWGTTAGMESKGLPSEFRLLLMVIGIPLWIVGMAARFLVAPILILLSTLFEYLSRLGTDWRSITAEEQEHLDKWGGPGCRHILCMHCSRAWASETWKYYDWCCPAGCFPGMARVGWHRIGGLSYNKLARERGYPKVPVPGKTYDW